MTAHQNAATSPDARADRAPPHRGRRRPAVRWTAHGVLFVALAVGIFGLVAQAVLLGRARLPDRELLAPATTGRRRLSPAQAAAGCRRQEERQRKARDSAAWLTALQALFFRTKSVPCSAKHLRNAARPPIQR